MQYLWFPSAPPSLPPSLTPSLPPSLPLSLPPSLSHSFSPSLSPSLLQTKSYRNDGYDWKTRKMNIKSVREDRMKLKVCGMQVSG